MLLTTFCFLLRWGWFCSDVPWSRQRASPTGLQTAPWSEDFLLVERKPTDHTFLLSDPLNFDLHYCCQAEGAPASLPPSINGPQSHRSDRRKPLYFITVPKTRTVLTDARPPPRSPPANLRKPVNTVRRDRGKGPNAQSRTDCFIPKCWKCFLQLKQIC